MLKKKKKINFKSYSISNDVAGNTLLKMWRSFLKTKRFVEDTPSYILRFRVILDF